MSLARFRASRRRLAAGAAVGLLALTLMPMAGTAQQDPRVGLPPGYIPWSEAASGIELLDNTPREGAFNVAPDQANYFSFINSDLAFTGDYAIAGNYNGFQVYDVSDPNDPTLFRAFVCPGGQGDVSVYGNLLFMSVEETRGRIDCGSQGAPGAVNAERFRGVRIFDITDINNPVQLPGVQTCRGSHTHTVVSDPNDPDNVYIYNSGTAGVRAPEELAGCENAALTTAPVTTGNPTQWRIDVIQVPLADPASAAIVSQPRIFTDPATGAFNGLQNTLPGTALHPSGTVYSPTPNTNTCHDITAYPEIGLAAGACAGNGILLDITDPVNPVRLDAVADPNFSYWHSATINNDGTKVIFTDEWGGGTAARCRVTDQLNWGADAIFDIVDGKMVFRSYYKMPAPQTPNENCVAHNASLVPVPGRDLLVQAWYQGGLSVIDFTDSANPVEIAYYDRGPILNGVFSIGGLWSSYWYNGHVFGTEIARGFDSFGFVEGPLLTGHELDAARQVQLEQFNAQHQTRFTWDPSWSVVGAYYDQAVRNELLDPRIANVVAREIERAMEYEDRGANPRVIAARLQSAARRVGDAAPGLYQALLDLAATYTP